MFAGRHQRVAGTEAIVNDGAVFTVTTDAKLRRLRASNGSTVWTTSLACTTRPTARSYGGSRAWPGVLTRSSSAAVSSSGSARVRSRRE